MVNKKKGFTIAEMLACMLVISILVSLAIKVFTRHHTKQMYNPVHGYFLCYKDETTGNIMQKNGTEAPEVASSGYCSFRPVKAANYYVVYAVGGGGGGGSEFGGSQGEFASLFLTSIADTLSIYPGSGGDNNSNGRNTIISNPGNETILTVSGGLLGKRNSISYDNIEYCNAYALPKVLENKDFKLDTTDIPKCEANKTGIVASVCSPSVESKNQDTEINDFFSKFESAWSYSKNNATNEYYVAYDGKFPYDSELNRLYYRLYPNNSVYSSADMYYDGNTHALYKYSTTYEKWYYAGVPLDEDAKQSPTCVSETLAYDDIILGKDDVGRYITRTSSTSSPLFKIVVKLNKNLSETNLSSDESDSEFVTYVKNSGVLNSSFSLVQNAGKGGKATQAGHAGAVMISW
jgi:prepilin-type N-terminal cleavage/methylation domain-containing protein